MKPQSTRRDIVTIIAVCVTVIGGFYAALWVLAFCGIRLRNV